ncbi:hypothetical protein [Alteribacillus bidgolensis]|uniref:Uncharacterized protein n=1 Tax=Alteribacillus bidgolensis TaxID=930129 RepID=A0A1G8FX89_9BACI|nr:hypothetical protein [Alteribacillus bidgolensis]SDH86751.1 hypothetical protein SAMN05216352_103129 [Alteribacillus bidgolensis]
MNIGAVLVITLVSALITLFEWPRMNQKKEKMVFVLITVSGWLLSVVLVFYSTIPGPNILIEILFRPLGKLLDK